MQTSLSWRQSHAARTCRRLQRPQRASAAASQRQVLIQQQASPGWLAREAERLVVLRDDLRACASVDSKVALLEQHGRVQEFRAAQTSRSESALWAALERLPLDARYVLLCLPALGQEHLLSVPPRDGRWDAPLAELAAALKRIDAFYGAALGGLPGYQAACVQRLAAAVTEEQEQPVSAEYDGDTSAVSFYSPPGLGLAGEGGPAAATADATANGLLAALPTLAEVLPLGGAGDRLGLVCGTTGEPLPAAVLPFCGRPLLEGILRDTTAREYLHWRLTGAQLTTPVAVMTSDAKGNHARVSALLARRGWFGRPPGSFRLFRQPLVPVVDAANGRWLLPAPLAPMLKPGGHGALWKLMADEGVFDWLSAPPHSRTAALVRQISNPMAGTDATLLALAGAGHGDGYRRRAFGFMSCERASGAAEGVNVLMERRTWAPDDSEAGGRWTHAHAVTAVEYTELRDGDALAGGVDAARLPANTNLLYVDLAAAREAVCASTAGALPGLLFNLSKKVRFADAAAGGSEREVRAGRLECTMQNLADTLAVQSDASLAELDAAGEAALAASLPTFAVFNLRRKVTSSAKRQLDRARVAAALKAAAEGDDTAAAAAAAVAPLMRQTPEGAFYDLQRNAAHLLRQCGLRSVPPLGSPDEYLAQGPGFLFLFHPALGPLWDVVAQKLRGGALAPRSELVLEVAEARIEELQLDGSLLVHADAVTGPAPSQRPQAAAARQATRRFSDAVGRVSMVNVAVCNVGVDWHHPRNVYWAHRVARHEACRVLLRGRAEFEARDVTIRGDVTYEVPDGHRMLLTPSGLPGSALHVQLLPLEGAKPTWAWRYCMDDGGNVRLTLLQDACDFKSVDTASRIDDDQTGFSI